MAGEAKPTETMTVREEAAQAEARILHRRKVVRITMIVIAHVLFAALVVLILVPG